MRAWAWTQGGSDHTHQRRQARGAGDGELRPPGAVQRELDVVVADGARAGHKGELVPHLGADQLWGIGVRGYSEASRQGHHRQPSGMRLTSSPMTATVVCTCAIRAGGMST
jgi:hypothetical protein